MNRLWMESTKQVSQRLLSQQTKSFQESKTRSLRNEKIIILNFMILYLLKKMLFKRISNLRIQFIFQYLLTRIKQKYGQ